MEMTKQMMVFSGSVNPGLADEIATELNINLSNVKLEKFANGEIYARYLESIRGKECSPSARATASTSTTPSWSS